MNLNVYAEQSNDFNKCKYTKHNEQQIWEMLDLEKNYTSSSIIGRNVVSIASTTQGYIAVALENGTILIYKNGLLYNTFKIDTAHGAYFVFSNEENLIIYIYRGYCYEIAVNGEEIGIIDFDEKDNYTSDFLREKAAIISVEVDGKKYERERYGISNLIGDAGYCKVVESSKDGEKVIYESFGPRLHGLLLVLLIIVTLTILVFILHKFQNNKITHSCTGIGVKPNRIKKGPLTKAEQKLDHG